MEIETDLRGYKAITVATKVSAVIVVAMGLDLIPRGELVFAGLLGLVGFLLAGFTAIVDVEVEGEEDPGLVAEMN